VAVTLYVAGACLYVTALVVANVIGVKLFRFEFPLGGLGTLPVEHTAGMIAFPITFVLTDLLNEYYGRPATRRIVYLAFLMACLAWLLIAAARALPVLEGVPGTADDASFEQVFGSASLMYVASVLAFLLGGLLDVFLFGVFKRLTGGRHIWLRATGSTVVSQFFDSLVVTALFFSILPALLGEPVLDVAHVLQIAFTGYVLKFVLAVLLTPVIYLGRWAVARQGLEPLPVTA
jgi:uncharacterized integral membrane protein (TIGR00697 family)